MATTVPPGNDPKFKYWMIGIIVAAVGLLGAILFLYARYHRIPIKTVKKVKVTKTIKK